HCPQDANAAQQDDLDVIGVSQLPAVVVEQVGLQPGRDDPPDVAGSRSGSTTVPVSSTRYSPLICGSRQNVVRMASPGPSGAESATLADWGKAGRTIVNAASETTARPRSVLVFIRLRFGVLIGGVGRRWGFDVIHHGPDDVAPGAAEPIEGQLQGVSGREGATDDDQHPV